VQEIYVLQEWTGQNNCKRILARSQYIYSHVENTCKKVKLLCKTIKLAKQCSDVAKYDLQVKNGQVKIIATEFLQDPNIFTVMLRILARKSNCFARP